jgi:hypothetical protein
MLPRFSRGSFLYKLGFIGVFALHIARLFCPLFQKWCPTHSGAVQGRVALGSAFLLLAFLCAYFVKEKRLNPFAIKI